jgi:outer membrane protein TolC
MRTGRTWLFLSASLVFLVLSLPAWAQKKYELTAREAVEFAIKNVTEIKNLQLDREIQVAKNKEIRGQALPQINGTISAQHYFDIPTTLLPDFISPSVYGVLENEGVKDGNGNPIQVPSGPPALLPVQFGVPWQASAGFSFQQLFFQPDVFVALQARDAALRYTEENILAMEDSVRSNVYRAYFSVLIAEKRRVFLIDNIARLDRLVKDQEVLFKNGFAEKLDIDRTTVNLNNLISNKSQIDNLIYIGYASLKYSMGLKQVDTLVLKDTLSSELVKRDILDTTGFKYEDRDEVKILNTVKELQGLDIKRYKLQYFPTLSGFWNYAGQAQRRQFNFFDFEQPWFVANYAGINMSVPIFDGLQRPNRIKQAKLNLEKTKNTLDNLYRAIDFQREAAYNQFRNAITALDVQERNLELAEAVFNTTKRKYEQGLGSSFEVIQTEASYQESQSNYFQALYDAVIAKIAYFRALGRLE